MVRLFFLPLLFAAAAASAAAAAAALSLSLRRLARVDSPRRCRDAETNRLEFCDCNRKPAPFLS